jgi:glycogen debranching enzyme GlgX
MQMVMDSLRFWVQDMHVDGFRFDLASVLGRGRQGFERDAAFFGCIAQDPALARVKLIAEPWDIGPEGYRLGQFPAGWAEWNDRFRDTVRAFWLGHPSSRGEFARRLCASSDVFHQRGRAPWASINYVVSHDGFTLRDLLTWQQRRNHANGEDNRDGHAHNLGWNCGAEGPTDDPAVTALRGLQRALLANLLLAQGTPMLTAGDELGHSQGGNNNPYCQDNATTWIDWAQADETLADFCAALIRLRREWLPLGEHWYGDSPDAEGRKPLQWLQADGTPLQGEDWHREDRRALALLIRQPGRRSPTLLLLVNAGATQQAFSLPGGYWQRRLDSASSRGEAGPQTIDSTVTAAAHSLLLLAQAS